MSTLKLVADFRAGPGACEAALFPPAVQAHDRSGAGCLSPALSHP
jgi:hypothetical protein